jgi:hypothetical protein
MSDEHEKQFLPRWVRYLAIPGLVGPLLILVFIFITELAHSESRCPYVSRETRALNTQVSVREDSRNCIWDVEDHRFSVVRGSDEHVLGRRRFRKEAFAPGHYSWSAELDAKDQVHVRVQNEGHSDAQFREGTAQERAAQ